MSAVRLLPALSAANISRLLSTASAGFGPVCSSTRACSGLQRLQTGGISTSRGVWN